MKLKNIIKPILLLVLCSCAKQNPAVEINEVPSDVVRIHYSLPSFTVVNTRSDKNVDEASVNTIHILVFEEKWGGSDKFVEISKATFINSGAAYVTLSSSQGAKRHLYILANCQPILDRALEKDPDFFNPEKADFYSISQEMMVTPISYDSEGTYTSALPSTPLPMVSDLIVLDKIVPGETIIGKDESVKLKSCYAKISLGCALGVPLRITGYALHQAPAVSYTPIFEDANLDFTSSERVNYYDPESFPNTTAPTYLIPCTVQFVFDRFGMIVKGFYGMESEERFYYLELSPPQEDGNRDWLDFLPNHYYKITLTDVRTHGYTSIAEALANPPSNYIITQDGIGEWVSEVVSNGQYYMGLTYLESEIWGGGTDFVISELETNSAIEVTKRSVEIISDPNGIATDARIEEGKYILLSCKKLYGIVTVRVTVGNLYQDIKVTHTEEYNMPESLEN